MKQIEMVVFLYMYVYFCVIVAHWKIVLRID